MQLGLLLAFALYALLQGLQHYALMRNLDYYSNPLYGNSKQYVLDAIKASKKEFTLKNNKKKVSAEVRESVSSPTTAARRKAVVPEALGLDKIEVIGKTTTMGRNNENVERQRQIQDYALSEVTVNQKANKESLPKVKSNTAAQQKGKLEGSDNFFKKLTPEKIGAHPNNQQHQKKPTQNPARGIASKSPLATRQDWLDVMVKQPVYSEIPKTPLKVGFVTCNGILGPTKHVFYDGIQGSEYLDLEALCSVKANNCTSASDYDVDLWLVDANSAKDRPFPNDIVHQILADDDPTYKVFFVDYSDRLILRKGFVDSNYLDIAEERFLRSHIRFAIRCIDKYRRWGPAKGYQNVGRLVHPLWDEMLITKGGPPFHAPFTVRTDIADSIHDSLPEIASRNSSCSAIPFHPVDCISSRPVDIVHLWAIEIPPQNSFLRNQASETVQNMSHWTHPTESRQLRVETSIQGFRAHVGRQHVSEDYVKTLLQSKIVVVTQRDQWEDHFRLFEALAGGAMVLMDEMLSLPHSLQDGESVIFFHSIEELQQKAMYYLEHTEERLAIARKGWEVTMKKHRSWHRLEEMLFGKALTNTTLEESWIFSRATKEKNDKKL
jgi:hypothetical protein